MKLVFGLIVVALMITGCSIQKGLESDRCYNFDLSKNTGNIQIDFLLDYEKQQETAQKSDLVADVTSNIALSQLKRALQDAVETNVAKPILEGVVNDVLAPKPAVTEEKPTPVEETPKVIVKDPITYNMKDYKNKSHVWVFRGKANKVSGPARFEFDNPKCPGFTVDDLAKTYDKEGMNGYVYFSAPYEIEHGHRGGDWGFGNVSGLFTPEGCKANKATIIFLGA